MNDFIKLILKFIVISSIVIVGTAFVLYINLLIPLVQQDDNTIYIWGDSQMCRGIDMSDLEYKTCKKILTSAEHGAGVYDFLVFTEQVPHNSVCIIGYSQCCLLRGKALDNNGLGFSISAIRTLYRNNYSLQEILEVIRRNKLNFKDSIFRDKTPLYEYCDTLVYEEPLSGMAQMYAKEPVFYRDKFNVFKAGVDSLINKGCSLIFIAMPYYGEGANLFFNSPYKSVIDSDIVTFAEKYTNRIIDTIYINDRDSLLMHDLTHLNALGAQKVSEVIGNYIDTAKIQSAESRFIMLNNWSCN